MLTIYSDRDSPRWKYITTVLFQEILGIPVTHTTDKGQYLLAGPARINYSHIRVHEDEIFVRPAGLLFEENIREQDIKVSVYEGLPCFFPTSESDFPFDIFAASFYLLTRYEEYLPHQKDSYGRYAHTQSLAFREHFLDKPLVNIWLKHFRNILSKRFPSLVMPVPAFRFMPTYDIDIAYAYLCRGLRRSALGAARSVLQAKPDQFFDRIRVMAGKKKDPYDVYEWLDALHLKYRLKPYYFFLLAEQQKGYDRNVDPRMESFMNLVQYHGMGYPVGLHPSWQSGDAPQLIASEKARLEALAGKKITGSRQHYIRLSLPGTYRLLIENGIESDFSMGYGSINGFRASVSSPYSWYDLEKESISSLRIFPFCFMDANARFEQDLTPAQAFEEIRYYHDVVKKVDGTLVTIWHNSFFSDDPVYAGWKEVYEIFLNEVVYWDL